MIIESNITIREALPSEFEELGQLMVSVYSQLEGFPRKEEQPGYYEKLANIGEVTLNPETKLLVAVSDNNDLLGGVVYFGDMKNYGSGGAATKVINASGIRLLAVGPKARGKGVGKALTQWCIQLARQRKHSQVVLHTTKAMQVAWLMYERLGFVRSSDLDFLQDELSVYGFRLTL